MSGLDLSIVICSYHREALLAQALASVIALRRPANFRFEVLVVDNSDKGSAADTIAQWARAGREADEPVDVRGIAAHPANISVARNAGVAATSSPWVAFVDDDQTLDSDWLMAVARAISSQPHDAFFGAIDARFEAPERATGLVRQLFGRNLDAPLGHDLFVLGPNKTKVFALSTANSLFKRATTLARDNPFDLAFGKGGGEDYDLLCRLERQGRRWAWMPEARALEIVPAARCEAAYLRRRFYAGGQAFAAAAASASARPLLARWTLRARAAAQGALLSLQAPLRALRGGSAWLDYSYVWAGVLGKLSLGGIYPLYQKTSPSTQG